MLLPFQVLKHFQDADDPNSVVLVCEVADMEKIGALMNDPDNEEIHDEVY
ncbi:MAG: hypothetical protein ABI840_01735 [bacterium]